MMFEQFTPDQSTQGDQAFSCADTPWFQAKGKRLLNLLQAMVKPGLNSAGLGLLLLLGGGSTAAWGTITAHQCQTGTPMTLRSFTIKPDPPIVGKPLFETLYFDTKVSITAGATIEETRTVGVLVVLQQTVDLCQLFATSGLSCPIAPGKHSVQFTSNVPSNLPCTSGVQKW